MSEEQLQQKFSMSRDLLKHFLDLGWVSYEYRGGVFGDALQSTEFMEWMTTNVGTMADPKDWSGETEGVDWDIVYDQIVFKDPQKAVLTKLRWGDCEDVAT